MFEPDVLITSPQGSLLSRRAAEPVRRLMLAVFEQAILDLDSPGKQIKADARGWFEIEDTANLFSFITICHEMGIDPQAARESILSDTQRWITRIKELDDSSLSVLADEVDFAEIEGMELEEIPDDLLVAS